MRGTPVIFITWCNGPGVSGLTRLGIRSHPTHLLIVPQVRFSSDLCRRCPYPRTSFNRTDRSFEVTVFPVKEPCQYSFLWSSSYDKNRLSKKSC